MDGYRVSVFRTPQNGHTVELTETVAACPGLSLMDPSTVISGYEPISITQKLSLSVNHSHMKN